jgi:small-conductance mechanosensitive channel
MFFFFSNQCGMRFAGKLPRVAIISVMVLLTLASGWAGSYSFFQAAPASDSEASNVLQFLNRTIEWYRGLSREAQVAAEPSGVLVLNDDRTNADQVVRLGFDYARGEAQILVKESPGGSGSQSGPAQQYQSLYQLSAKLDKLIRDTQVELQSDREQLATAKAGKRKQIESTISELQAELDLAQARREAIRSMIEFVAGAGAPNAGPSSLRAQIEALARTFPVDLTGVSGAEQNNSSNKPAVNISATPASNKTAPSGILGLMSQVFELSGKKRMLRDRIGETDALAELAKQRRAPLINQLKQLSQQGDQLAVQADTSDAGQLQQQKQALDSLTAQFKQIAAAALPLSKMTILLGLYKTNVTNWRSTIDTEYDAVLKSLLIRLGILAIVLGFVFGLSELWRKTILRYVHEPRRRYQFLLLRKIVMWIVVAIVIAFAFASEISSVATFAGLITAGVAVALQNVILSIAGYFFLIGKFGVRVGDRVQIAGVNGEVVDIGLVRLHLLELGSGGVDAPTGRVVAFSNSIVFQPNGLYKPIPGTSFIWHEITLTVAPDGDYHFVEKRLLQAVEAVYNKYRSEMEQQRRNMERTLSSALSQIGELSPKGRLRISESGLLEVVISYPVSLMHAAEIDDRVTREVLEEIDREPKLKLVGSGTPSISIRTDLTPAAAASKQGPSSNPGIITESV